MKKLDAHERAAHRSHVEAESAPPPSPVEATRAVVAVPIRKMAETQPQGPLQSYFTPVERLSEAAGLAKAIGLDVCYAGIVPLTQMRPATLFGSGKVEEIGAIVKAESAEVVIIDHPVTPIQQRNLEKAWDAKVLDRTGLILEIFAGRAKSKAGRLQVELARLTYQKSRLVRSWTHLERQRGGFGFLGGPGETQIEADRRAISERIAVIRNELGAVERTRRLHRKRRKQTLQQVVSLVGYTNAGKSSIFNAFSGAGVLAQDMLFATLDPTLRRVKPRDGGAFILSDTVGFVSELPPQLIDAFHSTLEEVLEADLILHVRDIASPVSEAQRIEVVRVLAEIGIDAQEQEGRVIEVWNKADLLPAEEHLRLARLAEHGRQEAVLASAVTGEGVDVLASVIRRRLQKQTCTRTVAVDPRNGRLIHWLYENTEVLGRRDDHSGSLEFDVRVTQEREGDLDRHLRRPGI
ncbi:MAG: GTPase HflX [Rhodomicrobium sp.]